MYSRFSGHLCFYFQGPHARSGKYEIEVRHGTSFLDNVKIWKVFEDDNQIQYFLTLTKEFEGPTIEENDVLLEEATPTLETLQSHTATPKERKHEEEVIPIEYDDDDEAEKAWG